MVGPFRRSRREWGVQAEYKSARRSAPSSAGSGLASSALAVPALASRDQRAIHVRGDQSRAVKVDKQIDYFARRVELVATITGESIYEASGANAAEPGRGDLNWSSPAVGAQRAVASRHHPVKEYGIRDGSSALLGRQAGFARLAEQVAAALTRPTQRDAVAVGRHLHRAD